MKSKFVIAMPIRDVPTLETLSALEHNSPPHRLVTEVGKPVDEARNLLARRLLEFDPAPEIVVWLDDDAWWMPGALEELVATLERLPHLALLCGGFSQRTAYGNAVAGGFGRILRPGPVGEPQCNAEFGQIVPIEWCGFHAVAIRTSALRQLGANPFTPINGLADDYSFCKRLLGKNCILACHPAVSFAHIEAANGLAFLPGMPPFKIENRKARPVEMRDLPAIKGASVAHKRDDAIGFGVVRIQMKEEDECIRSYGPAVDDTVRQLKLNQSEGPVCNS